MKIDFRSNLRGIHEYAVEMLNLILLVIDKNFLEERLGI